MPEIPIPPELYLSYNRTIEKISSIYSVPSALESTSLILVTGLDIFFTVGLTLYSVIKLYLEIILNVSTLPLVVIATGVHF